MTALQVLRRFWPWSGKTLGIDAELVEDASVFDVFLYGNDYHNLKAAIKEAVKAERTGHTIRDFH